MDAAARALGFGTLHRGDDAAGPAVAAALRARGLDAIDVLGDGLMLAERLRECTRAVVVDAMRSGRPPGAVLELEGEAVEALRAAFPASTHVFGAVEGIRIARHLGWLPAELTVVGVEGAHFGVGAPMSEAVAAAVPEAAERVARRLAGPTG